MNSREEGREEGILQSSDVAKSGIVVGAIAFECRIERLILKDRRIDGGASAQLYTVVRVLPKPPL